MLIRTTKSVCPKCGQDLIGEIIEINNKILLKKECSKHGVFNHTLSNDPHYYKELNNYYFSINDIRKAKPKTKFTNMYVTLKCNINCPICFVNANSKLKEPSISKIELELKKYKNREIGIFGGEPTVRVDLPSIIQKIRHSGNIPRLNTNGIKIANINYLNELKNNGLSEVHLQFDGFKKDGFPLMRDVELLNIQDKVFNNLKKLDIPTTLQVTVARSVNLDQLKGIYEYAINNTFIKCVFFRSYSHLAREGLDYSDQLSTDELIDALEKQINKKISKREVLVFQKLFYLLTSLFKVQRCFHVQYYMMIRKNNKCHSIFDFMDIDEIEKKVEKYLKVKQKHPLIRGIALLPLLKLLLNHRIIGFEVRLLCSILKNKLNKEKETFLAISKDLVFINFAIMCNPHNLDTDGAKHCPGNDYMEEFGTMPTLAEGNIKRHMYMREQIFPAN